MGVPKGKRGLSSAQFLDNLQKLEGEVLSWCKSQGKRNQDYGLTDLFGSVKHAYTYAVYGNSIYLQSEATAKERKQYFDASIRHLHLFHAELTALSGCFDISNTKIERWMGYSHKAITQMESIKKSDAKRVKEKLDKKQ